MPGRIRHSLIAGATLVVFASLFTGCTGSGEPATPTATDPQVQGSTVSATATPTTATTLAPAATPVPPSGPDFRGVEPGSLGPEDALLQVRLQGAGQGKVPMVNGGAIRLDDNLIAEVFVDPFPTDTLTAWLDLFLYSNSGEPVTDSRVVIDYDMYSMAHGPFFSLAEKNVDGHYLFRLDYIMFGPWGQLLQVKPSDTDQEYGIEVTIVAVP